MTTPDYIHQVVSRCHYCAGCDQRKKCVDPLRRYCAIAVFYVDGVRYDPNLCDNGGSPMVTTKNDLRCAYHGCDDTCVSGLLQQHSHPPTEEELDRWMNPNTDEEWIPIPS